MISTIKTSLWKQFGASIDMLENAILTCPKDQWNNSKRMFYMAYHCIVFLDYYMTHPPKGFTAALPFTITAHGHIPAEALDDLIPNRIYSQEELLGYLKSCRAKCRKLIAGLTEERMQEPWTKEPDPIGSPSTVNYSVFEILLYNLRHVQHHAAQLNLHLRQGINDAPRWVSSARDGSYQNQ